jgi:regulator of replication initiation timing
MNLANEVSTIETELQSLRVEVDLLKHGKALLEFENETLRRTLAKSQIERDNYMRRAEAIKALLDLTGASLVSGINKYHATERELQAQQLAEGEDPPPKFLSKSNGQASADAERTE